MRAVSLVLISLVAGCGSWPSGELGAAIDGPAHPSVRVLIEQSAFCPDIVVDHAPHPVTDLPGLAAAFDTPCAAADAYGIRAATWLAVHQAGLATPALTFFPWSVVDSLAQRDDDGLLALPASTARLSASPADVRHRWRDDDHHAVYVDAPAAVFSLLDAYDDAHPDEARVPLILEPDARATIPGFSWVDAHRLAGAAGTGFRTTRLEPSLQALASEGVTVLVSLTEWTVDSALVEAHGLRHVRLPVPDFTAPSQAQLGTFIEEVEAAYADDGAVAVHCLGGMGRTGTFLAAYFVHQGMTADEALAHVRALRPGSVETASQEAAVHTFAASLAGADEG